MKPGQRVGRKERCPCGSGKQYGKCCYARDIAEARQHRKRIIYYFHIQHDSSEVGEDCPASYVNADAEWRAIEDILEGLPIPDKMYNDSFLDKSGSPQDEEIVSPEQLVCAFAVQPYLSDDEQQRLQNQIRAGASVRHNERTAFVQQLMGNFATLPCFSNNDRILLKLASQGVKLVACESQTLRLDFAKNCASLKESFGSAHHERDAQSLLEVMFQRNEFIAGQIDVSLKSGEIGVLFLGHLHNVDNDMVNRLTALQIPVEEKNECRASEGLRNLFGLS